MTPTCRICGQSPSTPAKRVAAGRITECCVCTCHDSHIAAVSTHSAFVSRARASGLTGRGIGYGAAVCGR